jgi:hypothetical protein
MAMAWHGGSPEKQRRPLHPNPAEYPSLRTVREADSEAQGTEALAERICR